MSAPIGVFDSGVGGLSVLREIRRLLPEEDLLYVADSAHAPYGDREAQFIEARSLAAIRFLVERQAKAIVIACNTATSVAVESLRSRFGIPIVAIEPAIKPACEATRSGVVGVLATSRTLEGANVARLAAEHGRSVRVLMQPCPGLVECVEEGDLDGERPRRLVERYLQPLLEQNADTIVLGCTHYPFLAPLIQQAAGATVTLVNPASAVAKQLARRLEAAGARRSGAQAAGSIVFCSSAPASSEAVIRRLWSADAEVRPLP